MLRHKAYIQCARMTFGISEMVDPDEADRIRSGERDVTPPPSRAMVDYQAIEAQMAACKDYECLKSISTGIREDFEKRGIWNAEKAIIIEMNGRHKQRIAAMQDIAEAEFEEVNEDEQSAAESATEPKEPIEGTAVEFE